MVEPIARPKRAARAPKRAPVAVPFMPDAAAVADQPIAALIDDIAHVPATEHLSPPRDTDVQPPATGAVAGATPPIQPDQTTAVPTAPTIQEDETMTDTMHNTAQTMQADAVAKGEQAFEQLTAFGHGNVEAIVESTRVAVKGAEAMAHARVAFARQSFEATVRTLTSMSEVRSPADLFKLQGEYLRSSVDALVAETSRSTEATLKLAGEIAQPIQNRVALAAQKVRAAA